MASRYTPAIGTTCYNGPVRNGTMRAYASGLYNKAMLSLDAASHDLLCPAVRLGFAPGDRVQVTSKWLTLSLPTLGSASMPQSTSLSITYRAGVPENTIAVDVRFQNYRDDQGAWILWNATVPLAPSTPVFNIHINTFNLHHIDFAVDLPHDAWVSVNANAPTQHSVSLKGPMQLCMDAPLAASIAVEKTRSAEISTHVRTPLKIWAIDATLALLKLQARVIEMDGDASDITLSAPATQKIALYLQTAGKKPHISVLLDDNTPIQSLTVISTQSLPGNSGFLDIVVKPPAQKTSMFGMLKRPNTLNITSCLDTQVWTPLPPSSRTYDELTMHTDQVRKAEILAHFERMTLTGWDQVYLPSDAGPCVPELLPHVRAVEPLLLHQQHVVEPPVYF